MKTTRTAPIHRYTDGSPYRLAMGRNAEREPVQDRLASALAVIDLPSEAPGQGSFLRTIVREMRIRFYSASTVRSYRSAICSALRWFGGNPKDFDRESVRNYLEYMVDTGHGASDLGVHLAAIRMAFDKMCYRDITLGLETPRKPRRRVIVLSRDEVRRLLQATPSMRDTLLLGLMYATGMRVSEVVRVRWRDIDFDRNQIFVKQGKGASDRHVQLPQCYRPLLKSLSSDQAGESHLFPGDSVKAGRRDRHLSPRTVQRVMKRACDVAGIKKKATPHSLRHAFATHSFEDGCDIRRIQSVLGHVRLETTTIYITVAQSRTDITSPLDRLQPDAIKPSGKHNPVSRSTSDRPSSSPPVGKLRLHFRPDPDPASDETQITVQILGSQQTPQFLLGIRARQPRPGFVTLEIPPLEQWKPTLDQLPGEQSERIQSPEFYQTLQTLITKRLVSAASPAASSSG